MNTLSAALISAIISSIVIINGVPVKADQILNETQQVVNSANLNQLHTALELYYLDHDQYPTAVGGTELVATLTQSGYFRRAPGNPDAFDYQPLKDGQDYQLSLR